MDISRPSTAVTALVCLALVCAYRFQEALTAAGIPISHMIGDYSSVLTFLGHQLPHCRCDRGFSFPSPTCTPLPTRPRCGLRRRFLLFRTSSRLRLFNRSSCTHAAPPRHSPAHCFHHSFCGAIHQPTRPVFNVVCLWPVTESSVATIGRRHRLHHDNCSFAQHPHAVSDGGFAPERVG